MGKITLGDSSFGTIDAVEGRYVGDLPPAGAYRVKTGKTWTVKTTQSGDQMLGVPLTIAETGKKAKYNGATIWHNLVLGKTSMPFVNMFLKACGIDPKKFHGADAKTDEKGNLIAVRGVKIGDLELMVSTRRKEYKGVFSLEVTSAALATEATDEKDEEDFDDDDDNDDDEVIEAEIVEEEDTF